MGRCAQGMMTDPETTQSGFDELESPPVASSSAEVDTGLSTAEKDESAPSGDDSLAPADDVNAAGESEEETSSTTTVPGMLWYVLRVASNKEEQVREALVRKITVEGMEDRVGRILVPTLKEKKMRSGVLKVIERKLYPGYVFVEMACEEDGSVSENVWFLIKETTGVGDFIGSDGKPTSMSSNDVVQMLEASQKAEEEPSLSGMNIQNGDQVKITDGVFESYEGEVESVDERRGMVNVIVSIFGRMTPVEVGYWQLEKIE